MSVCAIVVRIQELESSSSGRRMDMDILVSARTTLGLSGALGCVAGRATTKDVLVVSSSRTLMCWTRSLSEHGVGRGTYL